MRRPWLDELTRVLLAALLGTAGLLLAYTALAAPIATPRGGASSATAPTTANAAMKVTVTGTIEAAQWDATGNATAVRIADASGGRFLVARAGKGKELLDHVGRAATVRGRIVSGGSGSLLHVETYRLSQG